MTGAAMQEKTNPMGVGPSMTHEAAGAADKATDGHRKDRMTKTCDGGSHVTLLDDDNDDYLDGGEGLSSIRYPLLSCCSSPSRVTSFLFSVIRHVVPPEMIGSKHNWR